MDPFPSVHAWARERNGDKGEGRETLCRTWSPREREERGINSELREGVMFTEKERRARHQREKALLYSSPILFVGRGE